MISSIQPNLSSNAAVESPARKPYSSPVLKCEGTLGALTQGFAGSVPDEQGGQTKRNPFQG
ncbi:MAG: hypothetical protein AAF662_14135 [Pseudomonadota bacterium]